MVEIARRGLTADSLAALYLKSRGITVQTAEKYGLGFVDRPWQSYTSMRPRDGKCFQPVGLWIPNYRNSNLISVKCRCFGYEFGDADARKYALLADCPSAMFIIKNSSRKNTPLLITESELDAILLAQEGKNMFNYIALASAENLPDPEVLAMVKSAGKVYFNADYDDAGLRAFARWKKSFPNIEMALLPKGKDPTEAMAAGVDLLEWQYKLYRGTALQLSSREQHFPMLKLSSHDDLSNFLDSVRQPETCPVLGIVMSHDIDLFALSDGRSTAVGHLSSVTPSVSGDLANFTLVAYDAYEIRSLLEDSVTPPDIESLRLMYLALENRDASLAEMGNRFLGYAGGAKALGNQTTGDSQKLVAGDARAIAQLYTLLSPKVHARESAQEAYLLYRGSQEAIAQLLRTGLPVDWKGIEDDAGSNDHTVSAFCQGLLRSRHAGGERIFTSIMPGGTITGRFTTSLPNIQGFPHAIRKHVRASSGKVLVDADFKQSELVIAAALSGDSVMSEVFASGGDIHRESIAAVLGISPECVTEEQRSIGKAINFSLLYGSSVQGIQERLNDSGIAVTVGQCDELLQKFKKRYSRLNFWRALTEIRCKRIRSDCGIFPPYGLYTTCKRFIPVNIFSPRWKTKPVNYLVQGTGADLLMITLNRLPAALSDMDAKIVNIIHDEILLEVAEQDAEAATAALSTTMESAFLSLFPEQQALIGHLVDCRTGKTWADVKG